MGGCAPYLLIDLAQVPIAAQRCVFFDVSPADAIENEYAAITDLVTIRRWREPLPACFVHRERRRDGGIERIDRSS